MSTFPKIALGLVVFVANAGIGVNGFKICGSSSVWDSVTCRDDQFCCGSSCCDNSWSTTRFVTSTNQNTNYSSSTSSTDVMEGFLSLLFIVFFLICCPIWCYRCCCRRTTNQGRVYNPTGNVPVTITLPPQQVTQQVPYPTVVPYPQQTPYPPQYPTNPYFHAPPPTYSQTVEAGMQQQSPSAPPLMTM